MKVFEFAGVIFNADNVCTIQKVNLKGEETDKESEEKIPTSVPGLQIVTIAGGINFSFESEEKRDEKFNEFIKGLENL
jgi:hypothetical protein